MASSISLFSGYNQDENRTTNYCLLLLKMLYEENPKFLAEVLTSIVGENLGELIGVKFRQQQRTLKSVPDGVILQPSFTVFLETKNFDWFHQGQLEEHLKGLAKTGAGVKVLLVLSNFESNTSLRFKEVESFVRAIDHSDLFFAAVTFEDFILALEALEHLPKNLDDAITDLRDYFDEQNQLPSWQWMLDVVNCAGMPEPVWNGHAYMCPASGGAYSHKRCKYFGMYYQKRVEKISLIEAVVDLVSEVESELKWKHVDTPDEALVERARELQKKWRPRNFHCASFSSESCTIQTSRRILRAEWWEASSISM